MGRKDDPNKGESPGEAKKRLLAEKAAAAREKLIERASRTDRPRGSRSATLPDPWRIYETNVAMPAQNKRTRAERREGRRLFCFLLLVLIGVSYLLYVSIRNL